MADELLNVIFRGDVLPGHNLADVKARFAQLFKMDAAKAEGFFTGKPVILKPNCDRATADKFKAVLEQAGAAVEVRNVAPAQQPQPSSPTQPSQPQPVTAKPAAPAATTPSPSPATTPAQEVSDNSWSLSAAGANLLRPGETGAPVVAEIDTSHLSLVKRKLFSMDPEEPLEPPRHVEPLVMDLSAYGMADVGESLVPFQDFVPRDLDVSALTLDAVGADVLREDERQTFVPANIDTSDMDVAPVGGDLGQIKPPPAPQAPATDHLSVQK